MKLLTYFIVTFICVVGYTESTGAQVPVFEDLLINAGQITGQYGSGVFSTDGYTLTHSGGTDNIGNVSDLLSR